MWRPESNEKNLKPTARPQELFKEAEAKDLPRKLEEGDIREIVKEHQFKDEGFKLSSALDLYTQGTAANIKGFDKDLQLALAKKHRTIANLKDPHYVSKDQILQNSRIIQLAYVDKIIEECDQDK